MDSNGGSLLRRRSVQCKVFWSTLFACLYYILQETYCTIRKALQVYIIVMLVNGFSLSMRGIRNSHVELDQCKIEQTRRTQTKV